ncbi:hypothetical protein A8C56_23530 [Niabella ginsenosidivorans]|uniref:Restriction endonuclease type IV Mrr domain-containing protein n=1 Tax=Niabella ginsenosidivorans TaxID=1176587 RepID=A0A1A9I9D5_9BACT|nr:restriction endonuclease [Niabella ginsenosidivorans]ANH84183.1 hypothetical protein A8C56_23530 [Niabella ginsenosidivorans]
MEQIYAQRVLSIKLGQSGQYEKECIENNTLRLGYREVDHQFCITQQWDKVHNYFTTEAGAKSFVATSHTNQVKQFYEEGPDTLWITFYANKLWWCFSNPEITLWDDKTKTRPVIGSWSDKDINGNLLLSGNISGKLLKTQGFRGTICSVIEHKYALAKINGEQMQEVVEVEQALANLKTKLTLLIQNLQWKDFETLVDLIFRQAGWQRVSDTGKTQKTLDLDLFAPVTGERAIVQIKAQSNIHEFQDYLKKFELMNNYDRFFYVVHTFVSTLNRIPEQEDNKVNLYLVDKVSELTISAGLTEWVIKKTT